MTAFSAADQLTRHGWQKGSGLGKNNDGITRAVSVAFKDDQKGVGAGHDFTSQWWDHVFNKATSSIKIETNDTGDVVVQSSKAIVDLPKKSLLYGAFVKSTTMVQEDDKDYSIKVTDEELFAACEGRTARKGARAEQPGKLKRTKSKNASILSIEPASINTQNDVQVIKKMKKKHCDIDVECVEVSVNSPADTPSSAVHIETDAHADVEVKKTTKKKRKHQKVNTDLPVLPTTLEQPIEKATRKSKKKRTLPSGRQ